VKALLVSRVGLSVRLIEELKKWGVTEFVNYYDRHDSWKTARDVINVAKEIGADTVVIIANFKTALEILASGIAPVVVITPKFTTFTEIVTGRIHVIDGNVRILERDV